MVEISEFVSFSSLRIIQKETTKNHQRNKERALNQLIYLFEI
jgi:hypothetical protein